MSYPGFVGHVTGSVAATPLDLSSGNPKVVSASRREDVKINRFDMTFITYSTEERVCR